ncbi:MAG: peptidase S10 [Planctomycetota bacterium]|nr:peptidase S10 [Planctomycetota bacterium]
MPFRFAASIALLISFSAVSADDQPSEATKPASDSPAVELKKPEVDDERADDAETPKVTTHAAEIGGKTIEYTATAGTLPLSGEDEKQKANLFFVAYTVAPEGDSPRPLTFCFNGGPGSSSVWLHMGMLGPKRVELPNEPVVPRPPTKVIANPYSLLDVTDLVFIDPVSTGYSRPIEGEKKEQFHGYKEDLESVGRFIHLYTTKYGRWGSPKFLCGESYGTLRAAGLAEHLQDRYNLELNGIVLVSMVLDFQTLLDQPTNDLPFILFLPSYATTAWYHKQLSDEMQAKSVEEVAQEAREFALGEYATALLKAGDLPAEKRQEIIDRYAAKTGLAPDFVRRSEFRVPQERFGKMLLREQDLSVGRFDSRYSGPERDAAGSMTRHDPSAAALFGPFTAALYQYLRDDLRIEKEVPYEILTGKVHPWSYDEFTNRYVESATPLSEAMARNPHLKVFVANGYYDLATPFLAAEYTLSRLLPAVRRENVTMAYYEGGHMMYVHEPALEQLREDLLKFYETAAPSQ